MSNMLCVKVLETFVRLLKSLLKESRPVLDGSAHESHVDEIKWVVVGPFFFQVIDLPFDIRRDTEVI